MLLLLIGFAISAHRENSAYSAIAATSIPFLTVGVLYGVTGFSLGILLGRYAGGPKIKNRYLVSAVQFILFGYFVRLISFDSARYEIPYYILIFCSLLYFIMFQDGIEAISDCKWLKRFGAWSYPIYMMQFPCFYYYEKLIDAGMFRMHPGAYVAVGVLLCILIGILVHYAVEKPVYQRYLDYVKKQNAAEK